MLQFCKCALKNLICLGHHGLLPIKPQLLLPSQCNNFSDEFATFLTGAGIPPHITSLPAEVLSTPFGQAIAPMLGGIEARLNTPVAQQVGFCTDTSTLLGPAHVPHAEQCR